MSILNALKETEHQSNNILDLAKLPQALIMQMAQNGQIPKDMVMPILGKKAEMVENAAKMNAAKQLASQGGVQPTVMEKYMGEIASADHPAPMPQQMTQQSPQQIGQQMSPEDVGIASQATQPMGLAGGGIIAFGDGGGVDDEEDLAYDMAREDADMNMGSSVADVYKMARHGISNLMSKLPQSYESTKAKSTETNVVNDADQARKHNVGNLRPSGFTYPGQIGTSKGGFAMFDKPESGIAALHHDIGIKLERGLDTPHKFISVYAPASDKNDVNAYSKNVANILGIGQNDKIPNTPKSRQLLANAIIRQEGAHKATASFANGGEVRHFEEGDYVDPMGSAPVITDPEMGSYRSSIPGTPENLLANKKITQKEYTEIQKRKETAKAPPTTPLAKVENKAPDIQTIFDSHTRQQQANPDRNVFADIQAEQAARRAEINASAKEDKNLALLAAGLGMLGGTSPYAMVNIGQGGAKGVEALSGSKTRRASELNALSNAELKSLYYGQENQRKQTALAEGMRDKDLDNLRELEKTLQKQYFIEGTPRTTKQEEAYQNALRNSPLYQLLAKNAGIYNTAPAAPVLNYNLKSRSLS